jgi:hypothetical protein
MNNIDFAITQLKLSFSSLNIGYKLSGFVIRHQVSDHVFIYLMISYLDYTIFAKTFVPN